MPVNLKLFNTFAISANCEQLIVATNKNELISAAMQLYCAKERMLILGGGSNIVLCDDFAGTVLKIETKGISVAENESYFYLDIQAGENWHELVKFCLENEINGLENLALIPGVVGAAPIQNIGAYGVEFCQICDWVEYLDLRDGQLYKLTTEQCLFGYRDSIFKGELHQHAVITAVGIKVAKEWIPNLAYGPLQKFQLNTVTAKQIFDEVCQVRMQKLPDPNVLGNAGSFFKNPIVDLQVYETLTAQYSDLVAYPVSDSLYKLAAGWLIDKAGLKGFKLGPAGVHQQQALVLVNFGGATGADICQLAHHVIDTVYEQFNVLLEAEPRLIFAQGEEELK
ncbi:UDP-N-acetylmuramate dehydrogenase [Shewanella marina]|uniref:UDP-N-acetylmuramate dehydrogenase n=1 Tax=Shewanella marina TaxID=487319 RepID=UPI0004706B30|nr:UDP-N-acetylmuramate dehydrogenase [Shewanella marina]